LFPEDFTSGLCWGAFAAIQELAPVRWPNGQMMYGNACLPPGSGRDELIRVFLKYMNDHPEQGHQSFAGVILPALIQAYPCKEFH
jgi:Rap1a immunity proteins